MSNYVLLNQQDHANLKVITERSVTLGDGVKFVMTFPFEFRSVQSCYPIFFHKNAESGKFYPIALFGFEENENLFLSDEGWGATYIPVMIKRQPFLIGYQQDSSDPDLKTAKVSIDIDNPRVNTTDGEALFLEHGGTSEYLQKATQTLEQIHQAHSHSEQFVEALINYDLLESFTLDITLENGSENQLLGFYTINEPVLQQLSGDKLAALNAQGFLQPIFMALASHSRIRTLIDLKNAQIAAG